MKVAAIDVGTNSIHLLVADVSPEGQIVEVERAREQVELGRGGIGRQRIASDAADRGLAAIATFKRAADSLGVEDIHAVATSAVREAENGTEFCRAVKKETGVHLRVISGEEEARLGWLGARSHLDYSRGRVLLFDLGGGSTEFVLCEPEIALVSLSLPLGHIRLSEAHHKSDPLAESERRALKAAITSGLEPLANRVSGSDFNTLVGTSGTVRCIGRMVSMARGETVPEGANSLLIRREEIEDLVRQLRERTADEAAKLPGMDPKRRRTLPAGATLIREIMRMFDQDECITSNYGLRDGLVVDWIMKHRPEIQLSRTVTDPRRRSVLSMMTRFGADVTHARHVARLALELFDGTADLHRLRVDDRRLLEFGALLHDVGHHISGEDHHRHGHYLISNTQLAGFLAPEVTALAALARYHRGSRPKEGQPEFMAVAPPDRDRIRWLAALLRIADALDRAHDQNTRFVSVRIGTSSLTIRAKTRAAGHLEHWSAVQRSDLLASLVDREVRVEAGPDVRT